MAGTWDFCPKGLVVENKPPEEAGTSINMNGWNFGAKPRDPWQYGFTVTLHGLQWYTNGAGGYDDTTNIYYNARRFEEFIQSVGTWSSFSFPHPEMGTITARFASLPKVPKGEPNAGGLIAPFEVELVHHNPAYNFTPSPPAPPPPPPPPPPAPPVSAAYVLRYTTRSAMAARSSPALLDYVVLDEAGREGTFVVELKSLWTAQVAADVNQGIFVASTADTTLVYRRLIPGDAALATWFGIVGDDTTNNSTAMANALAALNSLRTTGTTGYGVGHSIGLYFPSGKYYFSGLITVSHAIRIYGVGAGFGSNAQLRWPLGTGGFLFDSNSSGSELSSLTLRGAWSTSDNEGEYHAVQNYRPLARRDLFIDGWQGDGFYDVNDAASTGGLRNSNGDSIERCFVQNCRRGLYFQGGDVNGKEIRGCNFLVNRWCGIHEASFLGNTYLMCLTESNGFYPGWSTGASNRPASYTRHNNKIYACVGGQETWCSTNAPSGTTANNTGWAYWYDQPSDVSAQGIPNWASGKTWRAGGGVIHQGDSNRSSFYGLYSEDNQMNQFDVNMGGNYGPNMNYGLMVNKASGTLYSAKPNFIKGQTWYGNMVVQPGIGGSFRISSGSGVFGYNNNVSDPAGQDTLWQFYATQYNNTLWFRSFGLGSDNLDAVINGGLNQLTMSGKALVMFQINSSNMMAMNSTELYPTTNNGLKLGVAGNRWSEVFASNGTINTSDERMKENIQTITDEVLDAWGEIGWDQYQMRDAVKKKGKNGARIHCGLIAQKIKRVFESKGLDAFKYGVLCYDKWTDKYLPDEHEVDRLIDGEIVRVREVKKGKNGKPKMKLVTKAGDAYGVRYEEALSIEAAYQRRRCDLIEARLDALEKKA